MCQLINKQSEGASRAEVFGRADERLLEDFALYCGLGLQNYEIQQKAELTRAKQEVTREVRSADKFRTRIQDTLNVIA